MYLGNNLQAAYSSYKLIDSLTASFNGTTTSFPLLVNGITPVPFPLNEQNVLISVGGVPQKPDATGVEGFRFSGSNIVFSSAPKTGEAFWGVVLAGADYINVGVEYPDGSASVPSITFGAEKTTGFYRPASGSIAVTLNGVTEASFTSAGLNLYGSTSGTTTLAAPAVAGSNVITLPASNGSAGQSMTTDGSGNLSFGSSIVSGTSQASTSGTSIDFTGIPSWAKRVTVMFSGVSTNGSSPPQVQLGDAGGIETSNYLGTAEANGFSVNHSSGWTFDQSHAAASIQHGSLLISLIGSNIWVMQGMVSRSDTNIICRTSGSKALSDTLTQLRITTVNGTDTFDAGTINILYE